MLSSSLKRYLVVGASAYLIEMATLYLMRHGFGLGPVSSVAISFWVGFIVAFLLQKIITFKNYARHPKAVAAQISGYSLLVAWNYLFTLVAVKIFASTASVFIIRTIVIIIVTSWNYVTYRYLFKTPEAV